MDEISELCFIGRGGPPTKAKQSTHSLATCKLRGEKYYLKFSESYQFANPTDKTMQMDKKMQMVLIQL